MKNFIEQKEAEMREKATKVSIETSLKYLQNIFDKKTYTIHSKIPTINNISCAVWKEQVGFGFETGDFTFTNNPAQYQSSNYGLLSPFTLEHSSRIYDVKLGAGNSTVPIGKRFHGFGQLWELESNYSEEAAYFQAIIPCEPYHQVPVNFIESHPFKDGDWVRGHGYVNLKFDNHEIGLFDYSKDKKTYLVIESKTLSNNIVFEKLVESIIYTFGLLSGQLQRGEIYFLKSDQYPFKDILGFQSKKVEASFSGMPALSPKEHRENSALDHIEFISEFTFTELVKLAFSNSSLLRTIMIITESFEYPIQIQAATYSVALETIKNIIIGKNEDKVQPIKDRKVAAFIIAQLKNVIKNTDSQEFNNQESIVKRLENINSLGNAESLYKIFELMNIELNEDDKRCIAMRNDFLHGRMPFDNEPGVENNYEIHHVVYKLHFLISACILKLAGFSGYLRNNLKFSDVLKFNKAVQEDLFRKI